MIGQVPEQQGALLHRADGVPDRFLGRQGELGEQAVDRESVAGVAAVAPGALAANPRSAPWHSAQVVNGSIEQMPAPIATWDELDDCTHYVRRCLKSERIGLIEQPRANELAETMIKSSKTKTLALKA